MHWKHCGGDTFFTAWDEAGNLIRADREHKAEGAQSLAQESWAAWRDSALAAQILREKAEASLSTCSTATSTPAVSPARKVDTFWIGDPPLRPAPASRKRKGGRVLQGLEQQPVLAEEEIDRLLLVNASLDYDKQDAVESAFTFRVQRDLLEAAQQKLSAEVDQLKMQRAADAETLELFEEELSSAQAEVSRLNAELQGARWKKDALQAQLELHQAEQKYAQMQLELERSSLLQRLQEADQQREKAETEAEAARVTEAQRAETAEALYEAEKKKTEEFEALSRTTDALWTELMQLCTCPISSCIMLRPVLGPDLRTYDEEAITKWLRQTPGNPTSPFTRLPMEEALLRPNRPIAELVQLLQRYCPCFKDLAPTALAREPVPAIAAVGEELIEAIVNRQRDVALELLSRPVSDDVLNGYWRVEQGRFNVLELALVFHLPSVAAMVIQQPSFRQLGRAPHGGLWPIHMAALLGYQDVCAKLLVAWSEGMVRTKTTEESSFQLENMSAVSVPRFSTPADLARRMGHTSLAAFLDMVDRRCVSQQ